jgi:hypothetical protein
MRLRSRQIGSAFVMPGYSLLTGIANLRKGRHLPRRIPQVHARGAWRPATHVHCGGARARSWLVRVLRLEHVHDEPHPYASLSPAWLVVPGCSCEATGAGGDDEFQGLTKQTFTRPDGTQLGTQGDLARPVASDMKLTS